MAKSGLLKNNENFPKIDDDINYSGLVRIAHFAQMMYSD